MDIIFSAGLILFNIYCFFLVGAQSPAATPTELGAAFWPRIILVLMTILLVINIGNKFKNKGKTSEEKLNLSEFFKSKLFIGMILVALMAILMPYVGFMAICFLFLVAYGALLGERNIPKLIIISFIITIILYVVFQGALDIRLERGRGIFRSMALFIEGILLNVKRGL